MRELLAHKTRDCSKSILCFAGNDWWVHNPLTEKQWMRILGAEGYRILFVNSIGIGMPSLATPKIFKRIALKLKSLFRWVRKSDGGVWVLTPIVIPAWSIPLIAKMNIALLTAQIRILLFLLKMPKPVFWAGLPTAGLLLDRIPNRASLYYIQDNYLAYYDRLTFASIHEHHDRLLQRADAIICASIGMYDERSRERAGVHYIPHGVAESFLEKDITTNHQLPEEMKSIPKPIIGYWGSLEVLQDQELILYMAEKHPEWSFVFIGKPMYDTSQMKKLPNVHFLGFIPLEKVPDYGIHFNVAMINWVQNDWVRYSCPIKFREYFALGKPVVSAYIIEVEKALPGARVAKSIAEFCEFVEDELAKDSIHAQLHRRKLVEHESWAYSAGRVADVLESL